MEFIRQEIEGVFEIHPRLIEDSRGWFMRTFSDDEFKERGLNCYWSQMNHSFTLAKGAIRGFHIQTGAFAEVKLIRCVAGRVLDVLVDLRKESPTFLKHLKIELSATNQKMVYVPKGVAHGFQTLEEQSELVYSHSCPYNKQAEAGLRYDDPCINVSWPLAVSEISERDLSHPALTDIILNSLSFK